MELMGKGSARRIRVIVLSILALVGVFPQGLVYWYATQTASHQWGTTGLQVWAVAVGVWVLTVGLIVTLLWRRVKGPPEGATLEE